MPKSNKLAAAAIGLMFMMAACSNAEPTPPQTLFDTGLQFGSTKDEVFYRKGNPFSVAEFIDNEVVTHYGNMLPEGRSFQTYDRWVYLDTGTVRNIEVDFYEGKVVSVWCQSGLGSSFGCVYRGLSSGYSNDMFSKSSEESVKAELGNPDTEEIVDGVKTMTYNQQGVTFYLVRGSVDAIKLDQR